MRNWKISSRNLTCSSSRNSANPLEQAPARFNLRETNP
jgi:hypothetical protein